MTAKIEIGVAALTAPLVGIAAVGYQVALARQVGAGDERGLPEWDDPSVLLRVGLPLAVARFLYELPARLGVLAALLLALRPFFAAARAGQPPWPGPAAEALQALALGGVGVLLYNLAYGLVSPALLAHYARRGTFRACFDWRGLLHVFYRQPGPYLRVWAARELTGVAARLAGLGLGLVAGVLPLVGPLAGALSWSWLLFVALLLNGCLAGQLLQGEAAPPPLYPPA